MTGAALASIVALAGWLILALSAYRSHRITGKKTLIYIAIWTGLFLLVAVVFSAVGANAAPFDLT